jgi:hypothetical protein
MICLRDVRSVARLVRDNVDTRSGVAGSDRATLRAIVSRRVSGLPMFGDRFPS